MFIGKNISEISPANLLKGRVMQIEKAMINNLLFVSKVS